ncbi:MAG: hypothetical protein H0T92_07925 [Pyrinomonadaceae bacterium]|nr:hypothetical protein [Pyrinomonadaceae bacterium]
MASLNRRTAERERVGESDHLIYFILQSERFTERPKIEPALSAYEFVQNLNAQEKAQYLSEAARLPPVERLPASVSARLHDFINQIEKPADDERLAYFKLFVQENRKPFRSSFQYLYAQYARAMRFLYEKEFVSQGITDPRAATRYIASLYQNRGHSTDTQIEANFVVYISLAALKAELGWARQLNNVLIVGPGLDFAPRTDLIDVIDPQSYQPFAVADALIDLKLADARRLRIHCIDINERVIGYLRRFPRQNPKRLALLSGVADSERQPLSPEYKRYFQALGKQIGTESPLDGLPRKYRSHLKKTLVVGGQAAGMVSAEKLNIVTEREDSSTRYDLVVVTNVFPYFNSTELLLSLVNIEAMMVKGGYLIHNEPRQMLFSFSKLLDLPMIHARTELIRSGDPSPLYDAVWVHRK